MSVRAGGFCFFLGVVTVVLAGLSASALAATKQPGYPVPHITAPVVPTAVAPGGPDFTLRVYGANFINGSVVNWNRQPRATTFVSAHELDAQILAADIATNTAGLITVTTTSPYGPIVSSTFAQVEVHAPTTTVTFGSPQVTGGGGVPLLVADMNNDGYLDMVTPGRTAIQSFLNDGHGVFTAGPNATRNYNPNGNAALGDFDGDGIPDIVFTSGTIFTSKARMQVNLNNGDATFRPGSQFAYFQGVNAPTNFLVGDFNGDGVLDVVLQGSALDLFLGNGDGTFSQGQRIRFGGLGLDAMVVGDFNGDGKLDLAVIAVGSQPSAQIHILLGNGDGTFQSPRTVVSSITGFIGHPPLVVADLNGDGIADLLYSDNSQMGVLIGRGDGTFQNLGILSDFTNGLAVGDFNEDGKVDLLFWSGGLSTELRFGNGDGTFGPDQNYSLSLGNDVLPAADFNNDGLLDVTDGNIHLQQ